MITAITIMIFLILISIVIIAILFLLFYFKSGPIPGDNPIVYNFMTKYVPCAIGLQIKKFNGPDRDAMIIRKYDKSYLDMFKLKLKDKPEEYLVFFNEEQLNVYPKGTLSPDRDIVILLPPAPEDLPDKVKESPIGKTLSVVIEQKDYDKKLSELIREYSNRKDNILKKWSGGEITTDLLKQLDKFFTSYIQTAIKDRSNPPPKQPTPFNPREYTGGY